MATDALKREIERRVREAFLRCTHNGVRWVSVNQAVREVVAVCVEMVQEHVKEALRISDKHFTADAKAAVQTERERWHKIMYDVAEEVTLRACGPGEAYSLITGEADGQLADAIRKPPTIRDIMDTSQDVVTEPESRKPSKKQCRHGYMPDNCPYENHSKPPTGPPRCAALFQSKHGRQALCTRHAGHEDNIGHAGNLVSGPPRCGTCGGSGSVMDTRVDDDSGRRPCPDCRPRGKEKP